MKIKLLILILTSKLLASSYGELLFNGNCVTCHSTNELNKSAPTIIEIQNTYKNAFPNKKDFIYYMSTWVLNPKEETSLAGILVETQTFYIMCKNKYKFYSYNK